MNAVDILLNHSPYSWDHKTKEAFYVEKLAILTEYHRKACPAYRALLSALAWNPQKVRGIADIPFFPVRLFKDFELRSIEKSEIFKTMTSSGTTGQRVSRIYLNRETALNQTKVLMKICSHFLGTKRLPMLILDSRSVIQDRRLFSARGAGILGFSMMGYRPFYALDEKMNLDVEGVKTYLQEHEESEIFLFGFTSIIWEHFYKTLKETNIHLPLEKGILIHGGGWKKLLNESVSNENFKAALGKVCGLKQIFNYYGMVEQTGSIFMECEEGHLHASLFSDLIIRRFSDFSEASVGERGFVQLLSLLPVSYPGHSILTEDEGELVGIDNCPCGKLGKIFKIHGRIQNAEIRGCSDTYNR